MIRGGGQFVRGAWQHARHLRGPAAISAAALRIVEKITELGAGNTAPGAEAWSVRHVKILQGNTFIIKKKFGAARG